MGGDTPAPAHIRIPLPTKPLQSFQREKLEAHFGGSSTRSQIQKVFSFINVVAMRNRNLAVSLEVHCAHISQQDQTKSLGILTNIPENQCFNDPVDPML